MTADPKGPTTPRQFRFTQATLDKIDRLVKHHKLLSRAEAIRIAVDEAVEQLSLEQSKSHRGEV